MFPSELSYFDNGYFNFDVLFFATSYFDLNLIDSSDVLWVTIICFVHKYVFVGLSTAMHYVGTVLTILISFIFLKECLSCTIFNWCVFLHKNGHITVVLNSILQYGNYLPLNFLFKRVVWYLIPNVPSSSSTPYFCHSWDVSIT